MNISYYAAVAPLHKEAALFTEQSDWRAFISTNVLHKLKTYS